MYKYLLGIIFLVLAVPASADNGLVKIKSANDVTTTTDKLVKALKGKGMTVFDVIDHAKGAAGVGISLPPTTLVIFGNPKVGTPLIKCSRTAAIDLPQKMLIWSDKSGQTWLAYNDPLYMAYRHGVSGCDEVIKKITGALGKFSGVATAP
ncbi:MAG: DUF302 domain-containing protein [Gammaproteobacteria bacterium]|nr:MAG: DUF302 domain-containing protein [Gammaproteobacteria bacterium]